MPLEEAPPFCVPLLTPPSPSGICGGGVGFRAIVGGCAAFGGVVSTRAFARLFATLITPARSS